MKIAIVGYTGFVGSNLCLSHSFDAFYNSKNIKAAYGTEPDLLVYTGIPAEMFLANKFPEKDKEIIDNAIENIKNINPQNVVLISTICVYNTYIDVDENTLINVDTLSPYGVNRNVLELWVSKNYPKSLIVRLPALYGNGIKKNFIYDMINYNPSMLNESKFNELSKRDSIISEYYLLQPNGFYKCKETTVEEQNILKSHFKSLGFSALNFTDSRANFQFYNLKFLWGHINLALNQEISLLNLNSEPINVAELYKFVNNDDFVNEVYNTYPVQNLRTIHYSTFGGTKGYLMDKDFVLDDIRSFITDRINHFNL